MSSSRRPSVARDSSAEMRPEMGAFDFTLLVVGAIIGADVYIVAAMGAQYLGPAQIVAWAAGGIIAAIIGLAFVQCAAIYPRVGGSYAYTREAFGPFVGFLVGWALYVGEWIALPIFSIAFVNYLAYFLPHLSTAETILIKALIVGAVTLVNLLGVRFGSRANDVLTLAKLFPLAILIVFGLIYVLARPSLATHHLFPFAPLGWSGFGSAVLLIFWAYAGFELAVLPAGEVEDARRVLPRGLVLGMAIATIFYLLTSFSVIVALPWQAAATSSRPLTDALSSILTGLGLPRSAGAVLMSLGGLVSIAGVYDVITLSVARLSYAMAGDGLFPPAFGRLHPRFRTPYVGLAFQAVSALLIATFFNITNLIAISIFFLGICYAFTALAALRLVRRQPGERLRVPALRGLLGIAVLGGIYLSAQAPERLIAIGMATMAVGAAAYGIRGGAWRRSGAIRHLVERDELRLRHWVRRREAWLLRSLRRPSSRGRHPTR